MFKKDIDIRPIVIDRLVEFTDTALASRIARIEELSQQYERDIEIVEKELTTARQVHQFLLAEHANARLADELRKGEVVRVICPECRGSGLKPTDVTSERIGSAFEGIRGSGVSVDPTKNFKLRCVKCEGKKWVIMQRYKG